MNVVDRMKLFCKAEKHKITNENHPICYNQLNGKFDWWVHDFFFEAFRFQIENSITEKKESNSSEYQKIELNASFFNSWKFHLKNQWFWHVYSTS